MAAGQPVPADDLPGGAAQAASAPGKRKAVPASDLPGAAGAPALAVGAPAPAPAAAALPAQPEDSTSRFISGNLAKGVAGLVGMPVDTLLNVKDLLTAGVGTAQGMTGGNMPPLTDRSRVPLSGAWNEQMMRRGIPRGIGANAISGPMITPAAEPSTDMGRYAASALQMAPSAMLGRPTPQQLPRALATAGGAGVATEGLRDIGGDELANAGPLLMGAKGILKPPSAGERATAGRKAESFAKARELGIAVPPRNMKPDKPQQAIEDRINQDLRFPAGTDLSAKTIGDFNKSNWDAYDRLVKAPELKAGVKPNQRFQQEIQTIGNELNEARANLPQTFKSAEGVLKLLSEYGYGQLPPNMGKGVTIPPRSQPIPANVTVRAIKKLRADASTNFTSDAPEKVELAHVQRRVATALEHLIEDNLAASPNKQLVSEFKEARTMIAKGHDVLAAIDPRTGKVSADKLAALQSDRPLTGGMKEVSDVARAFPGQMKSPRDEDYFTKRVTPMATMHPQAMGAHWLTRLFDPATTSRPYQHYMVDPRSRLSPEAERAMRYGMVGQAANQEIAAPPQ